MEVSWNFWGVWEEWEERTWRVTKNLKWKLYVYVWMYVCPVSNIIRIGFGFRFGFCSDSVQILAYTKPKPKLVGYYDFKTRTAPWVEYFLNNRPNRVGSVWVPIGFGWNCHLMFCSYTLSLFEKFLWVYGQFLVYGNSFAAHKLFEGSSYLGNGASFNSVQEGTFLL